MTFMYRGWIYENVENTTKIAYQVTYYNNIESIKERGIVVRGGSGIGVSAYRDWSKDKIFFSTCGDDVSFWLSKYEDHATDRSDDFLQSGHIPLVLRFQVDNYEVDDVALKEGRQCSYYTREEIPSAEIEVYYNGEWEWLDDFEIDPSIAVDEEGYLINKIFTPTGI